MSLDQVRLCDASTYQPWQVAYGKRLRRANCVSQASPVTSGKAINSSASNATALPTYKEIECRCGSLPLVMYIGSWLARSCAREPDTAVVHIIYSLSTLVSLLMRISRPHFRFESAQLQSLPWCVNHVCHVSMSATLALEVRVTRVQKKLEGNIKAADTL